MRFRQVHLDFHTSECVPVICDKFDKKQFQEALKAGHVDSITVFSKCHHGWSYHPTKANEMHPGLSFDLLGAQIEAAHEIGVKTPVYISAGFDEKYAKQHPGERVFNENENDVCFLEDHYHQLCMNTPYLDYLCKQIVEVCENYDADGIFLDIVGERICTCPACIKSMFEKGMDPANPKDVVEHGKLVYANYLERTREAIDSVKPGLPLFHNGGHLRQGRRDLAYGNTHQELESLPTGGWGYDHFPFSARYAWTLDTEYLGMTGKFHTYWGEFGGYKHPNALRYEVALSVAHSAKCSIGDQLVPNGKMDMATYELIGTAFKEIEEKEPWLDNVKPVCDVAVVSNEAAANAVGGADKGNALQKSDTGAGRILIEGKYQFSVVDFEEDLDKFKVVVLPDDITLTPEMKAKIDTFLAKGGKLLATGKSGIKNGKFIFDFGAEYEGDNEYCPAYIRPCFNNPYEADHVMYSQGTKLKLTTGTELAKRVDPHFNRSREHFCSHQHGPSAGKDCGCGMVQGKDGIYIAWNIFEDYAIKGELIAKEVVLYALDTLLGNDKVLDTNLGSMGVATLMKQDTRYVAHLLYAVPTKRGDATEIIEDIYPVHDVTLSIKVPEAVKRVYLAPQMTDIPYTIEDGRVNVKVDEIDCHQMVVFDV